MIQFLKICYLWIIKTTSIQCLRSLLSGTKEIVGLCLPTSSSKWNNFGTSVEDKASTHLSSYLERTFWMVVLILKRMGMPTFPLFPLSSEHNWAQKQYCKSHIKKDLPSVLLLKEIVGSQWNRNKWMGIQTFHVDVNPVKGILNPDLVSEPCSWVHGRFTRLRNWSCNMSAATDIFFP